jgi:hypothetical protein
VIERWDGADWRIVSSPKFGRSDELNAVAAPDAAHAFAVGEFGVKRKAKPLIEQFDGTAWSMARLGRAGPGYAIELTGVAASSWRDAWAVGNRDLGDVQATLMLHWNGSAWSKVPTQQVPGSVETVLYKVAVVSPSDAWAVGFSYDQALGQRPVAEHWDGIAWSVIPTPDPEEGSFENVAADASNDAWAVGFPIGAPGPLAEHWDGSSWSTVTVHHPSRLDGLSGVTASPAGVFAVGEQPTRSPIAERWDGTSFRPMATAPVGSHHFIVLDSATSDGSTVWASGSYTRKGTMHPTAEYLC